MPSRVVWKHPMVLPWLTSGRTNPKESSPLRWSKVVVFRMLVPGFCERLMLYLKGLSFSPVG